MRERTRKIKRGGYLEEFQACCAAGRVDSRLVHVRASSGFHGKGGVKMVVSFLVG